MITKKHSPPSPPHTHIYLYPPLPRSSLFVDPTSALSGKEVDNVLLAAGSGDKAIHHMQEYGKLGRKMKTPVDLVNAIIETAENGFVFLPFFFFSSFLKQQINKLTTY